MLALLAIVVAALLNAFGQGARDSVANAGPATLRVQAPERVRGGLFFQGRFDIVARRRIASPQLILGPGWTEQMQLNTVEPGPDKESARDGRLELTYGSLEAGEHLTIWMQFEVNPTGVGQRDQSVELRDGTTRIARIARSITVLP